MPNGKTKPAGLRQPGAPLCHEAERIRWSLLVGRVKACLFQALSQVVSRRDRIFIGQQQAKKRSKTPALTIASSGEAGNPKPLKRRWLSLIVRPCHLCVVACFDVLVPGRVFSTDCSSV